MPPRSNTTSLMPLSKACLAASEPMVLAPATFAGVMDALALVRFRRIESADLRSDLADNHLVRAFDGQLGVFLDRHFDLVGNVVIQRMRITERQVHNLARDGGLETDALNLEFL